MVEQREDHEAGSRTPVPGLSLAGLVRSLRQTGSRLVSLAATPRPAGAPTRRRRGRTVGVLAAVVTVVVGSGLLYPTAAQAADACVPLVNPVLCENSKAGTPQSVWDIAGSGDATIQGFSTDMSVNVGQSVSFKIKTDSSSYSIKIYRLGYYNGDGAREIATIAPSASLPQVQNDCVHDNVTDMTDCGNWDVSASWPVPASSVSGVYFARLIRNDGSHGESHIPFVVRNDASTSAVFFQTSDSSWQAYNRYGGADFYTGSLHGRAYKVSYNRPILTRGDNGGRDFLFSNEYPMIRFLESNGYDVSYTTDIDSDRHGDLIKNHHAFLSIGHDEYWSGNQRANVAAARDAGVNLAFFSGNEVYWKTRLEASTDGANTPNRTVVCYKETWGNAKIDQTSSEWTGTYRDPRFSPPSNGGQPENALTGTAYMSNSDDIAMQVLAAQGKNRFWRNTTVATLGTGQTATLPDHTIGYESDEDLDNGFRPAGLIWLSTTTDTTPEYLRDFGNTVTAGTTTHHMTMYKAASGALVFGAGTIQYAWGLDATHDGFATLPADSRMRQATVNLLADMDALPGSLVAGLQPAAASTDTTAPTATITSPAASASVAAGSVVTVTGTASDTGGVVAGVEVSTDGGTTWHAATGTTTWSYSYVVSGSGTASVSARAIDDSANIGTAPAVRSLTLTGAESLFGALVPKIPATGDTTSAEVGVKVKPTVNGQVTGIRFYKGTSNTGTHTGTLWSAGGAVLATGTFSGESASGWQSLTFSTPVNVVAGTTYVASYRAPNGHYAADPWMFSYRDWVAGPLTAPRSLGNAANGVFAYDGHVPSGSFQDTNYYVDVTFTAGSGAPYAVSTNPVAGTSEVAASVVPSAVFSVALNPGTVTMAVTDPTNAAVAGTTAYVAATKTITFTPSAALGSGKTYSVTATGRDASTNALGTVTWSFTTDPDSSVLKLFATNAVPGTPSANDSSAVELGVRFTPSVSGSVLGVRYYQGAGNTGTHLGSLWSTSGTLLAQLTFPASSSIGWQSADFASAVSVTAGTTYVVSYFAPNGHYSADANFFASTYTSGVLSASAGTDGVYRYGSTTGFPSSSWASTNYWVDPLFSTAAANPPPGSLPSGAVTILNSVVPTNATWPDNNQVELGVTFNSDVAGAVAGVRFYKGATNLGSHTGSLWSSTGQLLATGTFANETETGWQLLLFPQAVAITPGTTYSVSYFTNVGSYAVTANYFAAAVTAGPLHVPAGGSVYRYGGGGVAPTSTSNASYGVDVVFLPS